MEHSGIAADVRVSRWGMAFGLVMLASLVAVVALNFGEAERFVLLLKNAQPAWLLSAALFQAGTYTCAGVVWGMVLRAEGHKQPVRVLARYSLEQLSVNQLMPTSGLMGNVIVLRAMLRRGVPASLAVEAIVAGALSHYAAFALSAGAAVGYLWWYGDLTRILTILVTAGAVMIAVIAFGIVWALYHRHWRPPSWLRRYAAVEEFMKNIALMKTRRVRSPAFLLQATALQFAIFVLDGLTLWAAIHSLGMVVHPLAAFTALVVAMIAATVLFVPGGLGSFEGGCIATLTVLGTPVEIALAGTLLLRGLSLWLPLVPGFLLARQEVAGKRLHHVKKSHPGDGV